MRSPRALARLIAVASLLVAAAPARAEPETVDATLPGGHGQQALSVRVTAEGIRARACPSAPCPIEGGALLAVPEEARRLALRARGAAVTLADGKQIYRLEAQVSPTEPAAGAWGMLLAAPLSGKASAPLVLWSGFTGVASGEHGEARASAVVYEPASSGGGVRVLVGERRDDVSICGRPALVAAREVDPSTLELSRGAAAQSLGQGERAQATKLSALRVVGEAPIAGGARLLHATVASSAVEKRADALTDGDTASSWSENKNGIGVGEFVSLTAASEVGIQGFDLVVRPTAEVPGGAAPRTLYLATESRLFEVTMPEDGWKQPPGARYRVTLPEELHAECVAVVLGEAFAPASRDAKDAKLPRVTLAEIEARSALDGVSLEGLVGALAGGGERARGAAALLGKAGEAGIAAAIAGYGKLDDAGKELARGVVDAAPCSEQVPFFAARFVESLLPGRTRPAPGDVDPELAHARDRLRRCGRAAAPALAAMVAAGPRPEGLAGEKSAKGPTSRAYLLAADEIALIAPAEAVPVIIAALGSADEGARRSLRAALARAAKSPRARPALEEALAAPRFASWPEVTRVDLLRAAGPALVGAEGAGAALASLLGPGASFRARYLLQAPAAALARGGDAQAEAFLRASLRRDADAHVRARAAEAAGSVPALVADLVAAVDDADPRARAAAISALAEAQAVTGRAAPRGLAEALGQRLAGDDWTFVRAGAARALGALPASAPIDRALANALADATPEVRGPVIDALGAHKAVAYAEQVRAREGSAEEVVDVRARATLALAMMCDARSVEGWTKLAARAKAPVEEADRRLGGAAIAALGAVHPRDIERRLAPLLEKDTPLPLREMARLAIASPGQCGR